MMSAIATRRVRSGTPASARSGVARIARSITFCPDTANTCARPERRKSSRTSSGMRSSWPSTKPRRSAAAKRLRAALERRLGAAANVVESAANAATGRAGRRDVVGGQHERCTRALDLRTLPRRRLTNRPTDVDHEPLVNLAESRNFHAIRRNSTSRRRRWPGGPRFDRDAALGRIERKTREPARRARR